MRRRALAPAALLSLAATAALAWHQGSASQTLADYQYYGKGSYFAYLSPWGARGLVSGVDFMESMTVYPSVFPNATRLNWSWPNGNTGIHSSPGVDFGDYDGTTVPSPVKSRKVSAIATLAQTHDLTLSGSLQGFDVITDMFLTSAAGSGSAHLFEIEFFFHSPDYAHAYVQSVTWKGTYTDVSGRAWTVAFDGGANDILFMPGDQADILSTTFDIKAAMTWLVAQGVLTGNEYFNGLVLAAEINMNSGSMTMNSFSVAYN